MNNIRFIARDTHGVIDYMGAAVLLTIPLIANFQATSVLAFWLSVGAGMGLLTYSLLTDYALSLRGVISLRLHLLFDAVASVVFLIAPFVFGFDGLVKLSCCSMGFPRPRICDDLTQPNSQVDQNNTQSQPFQRQEPVPETRSTPLKDENPL